MGQFFEFIGNHPFLFGALIIIIVLLIMTSFKRKLLGYKEVNPNDAVRVLNHEDAVVVDVRDDKEYKEGHIINALNIPLGVLEGRVNEIDENKERAVVVCCRTGQRAAKAAAVLQRQGFKSVYKLNGGMLAWKDANMPIQKK